uniref:HDC15793 n=1 Tax=Drosophila melanogaster TaxID=7227 RepID=Q6IJ66_DROME|nr:TPA_inf: HDC15793 [Drosophila melanogaster]
MGQGSQLQLTKSTTCSECPVIELKIQVPRYRRLLRWPGGRWSMDGGHCSVVRQLHEQFTRCVSATG